MDRTKALLFYSESKQKQESAERKVPSSVLSAKPNKSGSKDKDDIRQWGNGHCFFLGGYLWWGGRVPGRSHSMQGPHAGVWLVCSRRGRKVHVVAAKCQGEVQTTWVKRWSEAGVASERGGDHRRTRSMTYAFKRSPWWLINGEYAQGVLRVEA